MLRAIIEGHGGRPPRRICNASSRGHYLNLAAAWKRQARAVAPRPPLSMSIWVQELVVVAQ